MFGRKTPGKDTGDGAGPAEVMGGGDQAGCACSLSRRAGPQSSAVRQASCRCPAAYALSPIDLIPDFIPVIGYLDDIILLPLAIMLVVRLIPDDVMADLRKQANRRLSQHPPKSLIAAVVIVVVWVNVCIGAAWLALEMFWS